MCRCRQSIYHGYLCVTGCGKSEVALQPGETIGYRWVSEPEFLRFVHSGACAGVRRGTALRAMWRRWEGLQPG